MLPGIGMPFNLDMLAKFFAQSGMAPPAPGATAPPGPQVAPPAGTAAIGANAMGPSMSPSQMGGSASHPLYGGDMNSQPPGPSGPNIRELVGKLGATLPALETPQTPSAPSAPMPPQRGMPDGRLIAELLGPMGFKQGAQGAGMYAPTLPRMTV